MPAGPLQMPFVQLGPASTMGFNNFKQINDGIEYDNAGDNYYNNQIVEGRNLRLN